MNELIKEIIIENKFVNFANSYPKNHIKTYF